MPVKIEHIVVQGESIQKIARDNGYLNWKFIWEHPDNSQLKSKRKDPNILYPGDKVIIPPIKVKKVSLGTNKIAEFTASEEVPENKINIVLKDSDGKPLKNLKYKIIINEEGKVGKTTSNGEVIENIPMDVALLKLIVYKSEDEGDILEYNLNLNHLDPIDEISGIKARLKNLGFYAGAIDKKEDEELKEAIKWFQKDNNLNANGLVNDLLKSKLKEIHRS
jgi:hypothetical protein